MKRSVPTVPWRQREREWSAFAACVAVASVLFSVWPGLDLALAGLFYQGDNQFVGNGWWPVQALYVAVPWVGRLLALTGVGVALLCWRGPGRLGVRWWRRWRVMAVALLFGLTLVVHGVAKENWGRARPNAVAELGGSATFSPALRPSNQCRTNCSFVSGHAGTGFVLAAFGLLGAPATRRRWLRVGALAGLALGLARMAQGGHFASDIVFAGLMIWGCNLAVRAAWLRASLWRRRRRQRGRPG